MNKAIGLDLKTDTEERNIKYLLPAVKLDSESICILRLDMLQVRSPQL